METSPTNPDRAGSRHGRAWRNVMITSIVVVISTALLVTSAVFWSVTRSDGVTRTRQAQTVAYALAQSQQKVPYDQESVAIWDDSVVNVRHAFNQAWVHTNLGSWMYDYFKHDRTFVLDGSGRVLYAMKDGEATVEFAGVPDAAVAKVVARLRQRIADGGLDDYEAGKERIPRAVDVAILENRPVIVSVMPLVSDTGKIVQDRGTECLFVSVRFLDGSFLKDLADAYLLKGVRFAWSNDSAPNELSYPLKSQGGAVIGNIVWVPELPGVKILSEILPVFVTSLLVVGAAIAFLLLSLRGAYLELLTSEAQSQHLAFHDTLTGLPNRAFFNARLTQELADLEAGHGKMALIFLDLDRFKQVNDTLGHQAGDELIRELAVRLGSALEARDFLARMGGDEFAIIRSKVRDQKDVEDLCLDILSQVSKPFEVLGNHAGIGISVGVAMAPEAGVDRSDLARKADIALYQAKNSGRQCVQFFNEEMSETLQTRRQMEVDLRRALNSGGQFEIAFQPVYASGSLTISGVEALARWNHPRLGNVPPSVFVPLAEECRLIDRLGGWVLRESCNAARTWDLKTVAVNVSPIQFLNPNFTDGVLAILEETGLSPSRLEIEITESTLLDSSGPSAATLKALRAAGVRVALDDFGTGYSSLSYLTKHEVDRIKIDRSFVQHIGDAPTSLSIVQAMVTMAQALGFAVTAEGVETTEQRDLLTRVGCDDLQGYLLSKPLSALGMTTLLAGDMGRSISTKADAA